MTVSEAADRWICKVEADGRERSTVEAYRYHVKHIVPRLGPVLLAKLTPAMIERFRNDLLAKLSRAMARKVLTSLKSILRASNYGHLTNVSIDPDRRGKRKLEAGRDIPTRDEVKRMINAAPDAKRKTLLLTVALTGLRASELRGLRWSDVDLKAGELHVRQRADFWCKIGSPKLVTSRRSIPLDREVLLPALKLWKMACPPGDLVFPTSTGNVMHHSNLLRSLEPVMKAAHVVDAEGKPKYALHAFRHFFASWCINPKDRGGRELPLKVVQSLLGHSSVVMTMDVYGHLFPRGDDRDEHAASAKALLG
jgi:integrase